MTPPGKTTRISADVRAQMLAWADAGWSQVKIAQQLNADGVPTPRGAASWYAQSVRQVLVAERRRRDQAAAPTDSRPMVRVQVEARGVDAKFAYELARVARLFAMGAGVQGVEVILNGEPFEYEVEPFVRDQII